MEEKLITLTACPWCKVPTPCGVHYDGRMGNGEWCGICYGCGAKGPPAETADEAMKLWDSKEHMEIESTNRSRAARNKRYREYLGLKLLPYRNKEQEGRLLWLRKERVLDAKAAEKEAK